MSAAFLMATRTADVFCMPKIDMLRRSEFVTPIIIVAEGLLAACTYFRNISMLPLSFYSIVFIITYTTSRFSPAYTLSSIHYPLPSSSVLSSFVYLSTVILF
jgi:hypothetical protein